MSKRESYQTRSKSIILELFQDNPDQTYSVNQILQALEEKDCHVNITTVYRNLDRLEADGVLLKYTDKSEKSVFQYIQENKDCYEHLHIKCLSCGKIAHLDCDFMDEIKEHIGHDHDFELLCKETILYGLCKNCKAKEKQK